LQAKYDYAVRLIRNKRYDDAIPMLQDSQKDPRHKISSLSKIGLCFFGKGWYSDAIDIFLRAIDEHESNDDSMAKELRYNLARSYEEQGELDKSLDIYRRLAQLDFSYRDVRKRVDNLRTKKDKPTSQ
jgi:tetratricopeptide (TPR) repeat protein